MLSSRKHFSLDDLISRYYPYMRFSRDSVAKSASLIPENELTHLESKLMSQATSIRPDLQQWLFQQLAIYYSHNEINHEKAIYYAQLFSVSSQNREDRSLAMLLQLDAAMTDLTQVRENNFDLSPLPFLSPVDAAYYQSRRLEYFVQVSHRQNVQKTKQPSSIVLNRDIFKEAIQNCQFLQGRVANPDKGSIYLSLARCYIAWSNYLLNSKCIQQSCIDKVNDFLQSAEFNLDRVTSEVSPYPLLNIQYLLARAKFKFANGGPISPDSPSHSEDIDVAYHQINQLHDEAVSHIAYITPLWFDFLDTLIYTKNFEFASSIANFLYANWEHYPAMTDYLSQQVDSLKLALAIQTRRLPTFMIDNYIAKYDQQSPYVQSLLDGIVEQRSQANEHYTPRHPSLRLLAQRQPKFSLFISAPSSGAQSGLASPKEGADTFRQPRLLSLFKR